MEKQIKELQMYFKTKIVKGDFEIVEINETKTVMEILIDDKYRFTYWIYQNGFNYDQYLSSYYNFMVLPELSKSQKEIAYRRVAKGIDEYVKKIVDTENLKQYRELQKDLKKSGLIK